MQCKKWIENSLQLLFAALFLRSPSVLEHTTLLVLLRTDLSLSDVKLKPVLLTLPLIQQQFVKSYNDGVNYLVRNNFHSKATKISSSTPMNCSSMTPILLLVITVKFVVGITKEIYGKNTFQLTSPDGKLSTSMLPV